jgi:predicted DNA-binding protein with PD1-like motif
MKSQLIHQDAQRTYALIFDKGDEFISEITRFAKEQKLDASHFTAIGVFRSAVLGFFDRDRKDYKRISVDTQVEVLSLVGDIAAKNGAPQGSCARGAR